ncbi:anaphase-promoting complex subunit cdc27 [Neurospora sp. IMI 360204]|nr:anaphase-promoting complex subunit cdc27 [Neurospora sp. IMI 360204]
MPYPDAAAFSCLLGRLYRAYDDKKKAIPCFEEALRRNPFMWEAFTSLCDMGVSVRVPNVFKASDGLARNLEHGLNATPILAWIAGPSPQLPEPLQQKKTGQQQNRQPSDPFGPYGTSQESASYPDSENGFISKMYLSQSGITSSQPGKPLEETDTQAAPAPTTHNSQIGRVGHQAEPPQAPPRRTRAAQAADSALTDAPPKMGHRLGTRRKDKAQDSATDHADSGAKTSTVSSSTTERKRTAAGHPVQTRSMNSEEPRRSARLNVVPRSTATKTSSTAATRELRKARPPISRFARPGSSGANVGRVISGNRKPPQEDNGMDIDHAEAPRAKEPPVVQAAPPPPPAPKPAESESVKAVEEALKTIFDLLKKLASAYSLSSEFQCQEAVAAYMSLPRSHQDTPWVLAQMGRTQYEQANYAEADKYFKRLRVIAPTRLEDMEVYSTVLWHLKKETELSFLAHEMIDSVWDSPEAWCALGNAWSLAYDHEQALRCFKRATQLDPKFAYAYTLQGHEHVENEEYDKALTAYRHAIAADKRHYNAYYGIGRVYEKLGNFDKALSHYHAASVIHPTHAVLICCMGSVLHKQKQIKQALPYFTKATELAPRAPDVRLKKARALLQTGQVKAAQTELMILKDLAPDRAQVHFLLGKLSKTLHDKKSAVRHFTIALSLDPKASLQIKEAIESLEEDDEGPDDSMMQ